MSILAVLGAVVGMLAMSFIPWMALIGGLLAGKPLFFWLGVYCLTAILFYGAALGRLSKDSPWLSMLLPAGALLVSLAFINSAYATIINGGVRWRDRFYPTEQINKHRWRP